VFLQDKDWWWMIGTASIILSQVLILSSWHDARFGTIANVIILFLVVISAGSYFVEQNFNQAVRNNFENNNKLNDELLTESDIAHLPAPIQKYIRYTGSIGKPKVKNFKAVFTGGIRSKPTDEYMSFTSTQYNFFDSPSRIFYIGAKKMGMPVIGLHIYEKEKAVFQIKLLGLFTFVDAKGNKMDQGETVTVFNDMCFMAPATLIDKRIVWESIDDLNVKAVFINGKIRISATLYFNDKGELINFISNDRYDTDGKTYNNYPWLTPVKAYKNVAGYRLPSEAELIYIRPDGEFTYGRFLLKDIQYNLNRIEK
jgi:hypothetical protein